MTASSSTNIASDTPSALGHLQVLDLTGPVGQFFGKVFADLGADVIKVEPPGGDVSRLMAPFAGDNIHRESSLYFLNYNSNKRSIMLDLDSEDGKDTLRRLVATADVLAETYAPGYLDKLGLGFESLSKINPGLIVTSITPFGQTGPHKDFKGSDMIAQAMGGLMFVQGDDLKPPCAAPSDQASQMSSLHAAYATLAALRHRGESGLGQRVDVSMQEVIAHLLFHVAQYAHSNEIVRRTGLTSTIAPNSYYRCKDGHACLSVFYNHHWKVLAQWMGIEALEDPIWEDLDFRRANPDIVEEFVSEFIGGFTLSDFVEQSQAHHLAVSPMNTLEQLVNNVQIKARGYFQQGKHPHIGDYSYPGAPYQFGGTPWKVRRSAPLLDEHRQEIMAELETRAASAKSERSDKEQTPVKSDLPLKGIRIVDFTRVWAGPFCTRYLADLGAEVIKIETSKFLDTGRVTAEPNVMFPELNRSKLGITLNFQDAEGLELVQNLIAVSDVVIANFAASVMERRGLGYEKLKQIKPDIIMMSMPGYGDTGPYADYVAYGMSLMAYSGLSYLWGYPDSPYESHPKVHYSDFISAGTAATALLAALEYRSHSGRGQYIELAQSEALASTMGVPLMDYLANGRAWKPSGNRNLNAAPHNCYPCRGDDQWCAIACFDDDQWNGLRRALDDPSWAADPKFATLESRLKHQDELDEFIGQWTSGYTAHQVMRMLQREGVPAGAVQSAEQIYHDHHLRSRNFIAEIEHSAHFGRMEHPGLTVNLSSTPGRIVKGVPDLGEHNSYVYTELLGNSPQEVARMVRDKVID